MQEVYGQLYTQENVAISGIHTHSGPAGYLQYLMYDIPARGFVHETFNVLVNGIVAVGPFPKSWLLACSRSVPAAVLWRPRRCSSDRRAEHKSKLEFLPLLLTAC